MEASFKSITNVQNWRLAAIALGGAFAMSLATTAFAAAPNITSGNATGTVGVPFSYQITANQSPITLWGAAPLPAGLTVNTSTGVISGTPTTAGNTSVVLSAKNSSNQTGTKTVTFTINPAPTPTPPPHTTPTAAATISPPEVYPGDTVTLDGSGSDTNPTGGTLQYVWQQIVPNPATLTISVAPKNTAMIATFAAPVPLGAGDQAVTFQLKVTDNSVHPPLSATSSQVTTTVHPLPVANAGPNQSVDQGILVMLNGSGSTGVSLTYAWTAPAGITLSDPTAPNPTFTAPPFTPPSGASYTFTLVVTETRPGLPPKASTPSQVTIMVKQPPIAYASLVNDINNITSEGSVGESSCSYTTNVTLYGFGVDPDTDSFTYAWTQVHDTGGTQLQPGDTVVDLTGQTSLPTPTFTAPDVPNGEQQIDLVFQLTVNDGTINSAPSYVTVHVMNTNDPPIAALTVNGQTPDMNNAVNGVPASTQVLLDGSTSSDPNPGTSLTYTWTQINPDPAYPVTDLSPNSASASPLATFTAPAVSFKQGSITLTFELTVSDGDCTDTKQVSIMVVNTNHPPVAIVDPAVVTVPEGGSGQLDGSTSYDPDNDPITFQWVQTDAGPPVVLTTPNSSTTGFVAPTFSGGGGTSTFQLTVTDSHGASSTANAQVNVLPNRPPTANAGPDQNVNEFAGVSLSGSGTDPDGNSLTYTWSQVSGPTVNLSDPSDPNATFIAPDVPCGGDAVVMTLTADDGFGGTDSKNVTINIANVNHPPTAIGGGNQQVNEENLVSLHGTGQDADTAEGASLTFQWTQTSGNPVVSLSGSGQDVSFTAPDIPGGDPNAVLDLGFQLKVTAVCGDSTTSATDDITVTVKNVAHPPIAVATGPTTANEGGDTVQLSGSNSSDQDGEQLFYAWQQTAGPTVTLDDPTSATPSFSTPWVSADTPVKFKLTVSTQYGLTNSAYVSVMIIDWNKPPDVTNAHADVPVLWPPDHRMVSVHIAGVVDPNMNDTITITKVTQDEPTNGLGDGDTPIDAIINGDSVLLRAERSGKGDGRVYWVYFTASDPETVALGNSPTGIVKVMVPHDKKTDIAIDSGQKYDSTH